MPIEGSIRVGDRTVTYLEAGDPAGPLVLHNHGGPSSRLEVALLDAAAVANGVRIVCADRPGIGRSNPQPDRTFEDWADDLLILADSLGAERLAVTGWSEGGPWALAAAAYLDPARLVHVSSIGGASYGAFGANWALKYLSGADAVGGRLALHFHPGFTLMYEVLGMSVKHFDDGYSKAIVKSVCASDREVLADASVMSTFLEASRECFRQGSDGLVVDATLLYEAWPFDVAKICRPVHLWQGTADTLVPAGINDDVARAMSGAIWHPIVDGGHFIAVGHAHEVLAVAAEDLAA